MSSSLSSNFIPPLLIFSQPKEVKGSGFLTWDKVGFKPDDQWLYLPALRKVKRIRSKEKGRSFMGTDFSYEDLSGRDINADDYQLIGEEVIHGSDCYKIKANPKEKDAQYSTRILWVDKQNFLLKRVEFFNNKGISYKLLNIPDHVKNGEYWTASMMIMKNLNKELGIFAHYLDSTNILVLNSVDRLSSFLLNTSPFIVLISF